MEDIKKEIMKLEFQHKKDIVEADRRFNERFDRIQAQIEEIHNIEKRTQARLEHITKLTGITFDTFANIESRIENAANALQPQAKSK